MQYQVSLSSACPTTLSPPNSIASSWRWLAMAFLRALFLACLYGLNDSAYPSSLASNHGSDVVVVVVIMQSSGSSVTRKQQPISSVVVVVVGHTVSQSSYSPSGSNTQRGTPSPLSSIVHSASLPKVLH